MVSYQQYHTNSILSIILLVWYYKHRIILEASRARGGATETSEPLTRGRAQYLTQNTPSQTFVRATRPTILRASPQNDHCTRNFLHSQNSSTLELNRSKNFFGPTTKNPAEG